MSRDDELTVVLRLEGLRNRDLAIQSISNYLVRSLYSVDGDPERFHYEITVDDAVVREGPQR